MAVAIDNVGTKVEDDTGTLTTIDQTMTVSAGSNRALVTQLLFDLAPETGISVVWDPAGANQAMALISSTTRDGNYGRTELWGLVNPTAGASKPIRVSWTGATSIAVNSVSFTGVNQTGGATSFPPATPTNGNDTAPTITVASATGNYTMAILYDGYANSAPSQTETMNITGFPNGGGAGSYGAGAASVVHSWTQGATATWCMVGCDIVAGGAGLMWLA